jgi:hypothetical protein
MVWLDMIAVDVEMISVNVNVFDEHLAIFLFDLTAGEADLALYQEGALVTSLVA